ncbi:caspase family protein [Actinokineospora auranticolor]|uniref:Caspase domain-containing protein n=1 Tax=Actinokineospora auranticolor TaxID=155976 RepID=A0A2S6GRM1_9PSEU|nr:caspase family protein [Actinokineospora auranticolor]PPK67846.1 caspase domain-containing protein [Actinokineospora auranticolor]
MSGLPHRALSRAVLIGARDFPRADALRPLPAVRNNLADLVRALCDPDTGILDRAHCTVIDDPESPGAVMRGLRRPVGEAQDLLVVYYSGHGIRHESRHELYLAVRETEQDVLKSSAVPFEWLKDAIEDSPARTKLLILDCCYSGLALGAMSATEVRDIGVAGTSVITSSSGTQLSYSPPGETHTAFSGALITLLREGSDLPDTPLTVVQLYRSLVAAMNRRELPRPRFKSTDTSSDLVLRREPPSPAVVREPVPEQPGSSQEPPATREELGSARSRQRAERAIEPGAESQPLAAASRVGPAESFGDVSLEPSTAVWLASSVWVAILWMLFFWGAGSSIAGWVGLFWGTPPAGAGHGADVAVAVTLGVVAVIAGVMIRWPMARFRLGRPCPSIRVAVVATLLTPLSRWPRPLSSAVAAFSLWVIFQALDTSPVGSLTKVSALTNDVSRVTVFAPCAAVLVLTVVRRWSGDRR